MRAPTDARVLNDTEWFIVEGVFGSTLPFRFRVLITDAVGDDNRPFTIPTSTISFLTIPAAIQSALTGYVTAKMGSVGNIISSVSNFTGFVGPGALPAQWDSVINIGYIMNVGPVAFPDLSASFSSLLVHEMAHVWQGKNSWSAMTYVNNSIMQQCRSLGGSGSDGVAYAYTPGGLWVPYNAEQQASIIEDCFTNGKPQSGPLWPYIRDHVRQGSPTL